MIGEIQVSGVATMDSVDVSTSPVKYQCEQCFPQPNEPAAKLRKLETRQCQATSDRNFDSVLVSFETIQQRALLLLRLTRSWKSKSWKRKDRKMEIPVCTDVSSLLLYSFDTRRCWSRLFQNLAKRNQQYLAEINSNQPTEMLVYIITREVSSQCISQKNK